jgi:hypothetical protein
MKNSILILFLTLSTWTLSAQTATVSDTAAVNLADFAGIYKFSDVFTEATLEVKGGELFAEVDSHGSNKILKQAGKDVFKSTSSYGTVYTFKRNAEGKVVGVKLELMGQEVMAEKQ